MTSWLVRCYPAAWQARYGDEFAALLETRPLGPLDVADVLLGAIDAQLRLRGRQTGIAHGKGFTMSLRIGGIAAILGAALWAVAGLANAGTFPNLVPGAPSALLVAGVPAMLVALAGLSMYQARANPTQSWVAFTIPLAGGLAFLVGIGGIFMGGGESFWLLFGLGGVIAVAGSGIFAVATFRTGVLSRNAAALIGVGAPMILFATSNEGLPILGAVALATFALGWFGLGVQALRLDRRPAVPRLA
jgi:hypothetical protein